MFFHQKERKEEGRRDGRKKYHCVFRTVSVKHMESVLFILTNKNISRKKEGSIVLNEADSWGKSIFPAEIEM